MSFQKETITVGILISFVFICNVQSPTRAASVYAIPQHTAKTVNVYDIQGDQLEYQADVEVTDFASGAVGITINSLRELLFITYEGEAKIVWADTKTMEQKGFIDIRDVYPSAGQLAGIVADEEKDLMYTVEGAFFNSVVRNAAWSYSKQKRRP